MKVALIGGTRFIGRAVAEEIAARGDDILYLHRGETEPAGLPAGVHVHTDRLDMAAAAPELAAFGPDAVVDCYAGTRAAAATAVRNLPGGVRLVVLSSMDVYRAYASFHAGTVTDAVPLDEGSPVRTEPPPNRSLGAGLEDYEKLDVEAVYLDEGATVLRLPIVYGERDYQRREEFVLGRVRAGRRRMPFGDGSILFTRGYVCDIARAVTLVLDRHDIDGEIFNVGERRTMTMRHWALAITAAAGVDLELVRVPDDVLPADLRYTGHRPQHMLVDSAKARSVLEWTETDPDEALRRSVLWHLAHPPTESHDFSSDDLALASAASK